MPCASIHINTLWLLCSSCSVPWLCGEPSKHWCISSRTTDDSYSCRSVHQRGVLEPRPHLLAHDVMQRQLLLQQASQMLVVEVCTLLHLWILPVGCG